MYLVIENQLEKISLTLRDKDHKTIASQTKKVGFDKREMLLFFLHNFLKKNKTSPKEIKNIAINRKNGSFTSLRINCLLANAWAYVNQKKISNLLVPLYSKEPNITQPKNIC
jgi:tRNA A37 threonylcarbamoyladenosine modification protein TsaB